MTYLFSDIQITPETNTEGFTVMSGYSELGQSKSLTVLTLEGMDFSQCYAKGHSTMSLSLDLDIRIWDPIFKIQIHKFKH